MDQSSEDYKDEFKQYFCNQKTMNIPQAVKSSLSQASDALEPDFQKMFVKAKCSHSTLIYDESKAHSKLSEISTTLKDNSQQHMDELLSSSSNSLSPSFSNGVFTSRSSKHVAIVRIQGSSQKFQKDTNARTTGKANYDEHVLKYENLAKQIVASMANQFSESETMTVRGRQQQSTVQTVKTTASTLLYPTKVFTAAADRISKRQNTCNNFSNCTVSLLSRRNADDVSTRCRDVLNSSNGCWSLTNASTKTLIGKQTSAKLRHTISSHCEMLDIANNALHIDQTEQSTELKPRIAMSADSLGRDNNFKLYFPDIISTRLINPLMRKWQQWSMSKTEAKLALMDDLERLPNCINEVYTSSVLNKQQKN